jgi:hypothetical protein
MVLQEERGGKERGWGLGSGFATMGRRGEGTVLAGRAYLRAGCLKAHPRRQPPRRSTQAPRQHDPDSSRNSLPAAQAGKVGGEAIVEGQRAVRLESLDEAVEHAGVDARRCACRRAGRQAGVPGVDGGDRTDWLRRAGRVVRLCRPAWTHTCSCTLHPAPACLPACLPAPLPAALLTHHARLDDVHGAAADDGKQAGAQPRRDVAVDVVLKHPLPAGAGAGCSMEHGALLSLGGGWRAGGERRCLSRHWLHCFAPPQQPLPPRPLT